MAKHVVIHAWKTEATAAASKEHREYLVRIYASSSETSESTSCPCGIRRIICTEIKPFSLIWVREYGVGLINILKHLVCLFSLVLIATLVAIGMPLQCQLSVSLLYFFVSCLCVYPKDLIVIFLRCLFSFDFGILDLIFNIKLLGLNLLRSLIVLQCLLMIAQGGVHISSLNKSLCIFGVKLDCAVKHFKSLLILRLFNQTKSYVQVHGRIEGHIQLIEVETVLKL